MSGSVLPNLVSAVVPCFNEAEAVANTINDLGEVLASVGPFEMVVVDDGSTDGTREILARLRMEHGTRLRVVRHDANVGYGAAVKTGIRRSSGELILITDADGTYPHEQIVRLFDEADDADMVVGARTGLDVRYSWLRRIPKSFLQTYASWLVGQRIPDMNSGLRVFRRNVVDRYLNVLPDGFSLTTTLTVALMRGHYDVRFVPIDYRPRVGRSKIRPVRDTLAFVQLILRTGMYFAPLRVLLPLVGLLSVMFATSLGYDVLVLSDLTDKTVLLLLFTLNTALFALLADMIDKRS